MTRPPVAPKSSWRDQASLAFSFAVVGAIVLAAAQSAERLGTDDRAADLVRATSVRPPAPSADRRPPFLPEPWGLTLQAGLGVILFLVAIGRWRRHDATPPR